MELERDQSPSGRLLGCVEPGSARPGSHSTRPDWRPVGKFRWTFSEVWFMERRDGPTGPDRREHKQTSPGSGAAPRPKFFDLSLYISDLPYLGLYSENSSVNFRS